MIPMKAFIISTCISLSAMCASFSQEARSESGIEPVASFKGAQVTGVTVTDKGRIFVNFPRWHETIPCSVAEVDRQGNFKPYPDEKTNRWEREKHKMETRSYACSPSLPTETGFTSLIRKTR